MIHRRILTAGSETIVFFSFALKEEGITNPLAHAVKFIRTGEAVHLFPFPTPITDHAPDPFFVFHNEFLINSTILKS